MFIRAGDAGPNVDGLQKEPRGGQAYALAVDVGGTKMAAAAIDHDGAIRALARRNTPAAGDAEALFAAVAGAADEAFEKLEASGRQANWAGIGLATAAPMNLHTGTVSPVNIPGWREFPLRSRLADRYDLDVTMVGDAVAVAIAEHWRGAARGHQNVLGMVVSTGVGGGLILNGTVHSGGTGNAGQIGHLSVDARGAACTCGGRGCLEAIASGTSITGWARNHGLIGVIDAADVAMAARQGNPVALEGFRRAGEALGQAIAGVVTLLDLDLVTVGGGVAGAGSLLFEPLTDSYGRFATLSYAAPPRVVPAHLGTEAGLIGAAAVIFEPGIYGSNVPARSPQLIGTDQVPPETDGFTPGLHLRM